VLFVSSEFVIFFALVFGLYYVLAHRLQNRLLLIASYVFYGWWDYRFLSLIIASSLVDFGCGLVVDRQRCPRLTAWGRKLAVAISVGVNLGLLGVFKYYDFFRESFQDLWRELHLTWYLGMDLDWPTLHLVLPIGISFYTFQTMSYTIDVYRGKIRSTTRLLDFMLYVSFFPQLVAGPIERAAHLLPQVLQPRRRAWNPIYSGMALALVGYFKKMVIADNMAGIVEEIYGMDSPSGAAVLLGTYAFALQIYSDFSGYTDIARGLSRMLGFEICENFRLPYLARSMSDFWQRWHISLSSFLRDYLYIPLGGNRRGNGRMFINLATVMLLGGLWHGASWVFVAWGAVHGSYLVISRLTAGVRGRIVRVLRLDTVPWLHTALQIVITFHLVCVGWVFFRATDLDHALLLLRAVFDMVAWSQVPSYIVAEVLVVLGLLLGFQCYQLISDRLEPWSVWPVAVRVPFYVCAYFIIVMLGVTQRNEFIYFQF